MKMMLGLLLVGGLGIGPAAAGFVFLLPRVVAAGARRLALSLFEAKAGALQGAALTVASVTPTDLPEGQESPVGPGRWLRLEMEVSPVAGAGKFTHWEPEELSLIPTPDSLPRRGHLESDQLDDGLVCDVRRLQTEDAEEDKITGPCRLALSAYVPEGVTRVSLHYYTLLVGEPIDIPT